MVCFLGFFGIRDRITVSKISYTSCTKLPHIFLIRCGQMRNWKSCNFFFNLKTLWKGLESDRVWLRLPVAMAVRCVPSSAWTAVLNSSGFWSIYTNHRKPHGYDERSRTHATQKLVHKIIVFLSARKNMNQRSWRFMAIIVWRAFQ